MCFIQIGRAVQKLWQKTYKKSYLILTNVILESKYFPYSHNFWENHLCLIVEQNKGFLNY